MPTTLERVAQLGCSTWKRNEHCRRSVCRRYGYCVPSRDAERQSFYRCPFDVDDAWLNRTAIVGKLAERLVKVAETSHAAHGRPWPFAEPVPNHLDLTQPLDFAALIAPRPEVE